MSTDNDHGNEAEKHSHIAICGIGCIFPQADNLEAYWDNIKKGVNSITEVPKETHWSADDYLDTDPKAPDMTYAARGGFLSPIDFNPMEFGIAPKDIEATDTTQILGMIAAKEALEDAGYWEEKPFDRSRTSIILGVTSTLELAIPLGARLGHPIWRRALKDSGLDEELTQEVVERISDGYVGWQENSFPGLLGNVAAGRIANRFDLGGTNCVVDAACASSLSALHLAAMELASGKADMVLTGGIDSFNDIFMYMCFSKTPALSPTGEAKPFSKHGDGTILGEGLGILVLKRLEDAERDEDRIYAVIKGIGTSSDGKGNAIYAPSAKGQVKALRRAYEQAKVSPSTVELLEGHGTGTTVGDATEVRALNEVYSSDLRPHPGSWCALGSVKSQIGHTKAASGVAALIKASMALHHRVLPPTIKVTEPLDDAAPGKSPFYVNTVKRPWVTNPDHPRRAAVSSFGFGGSNFHCVLEEAAEVKESGSPEISNQIIAFSGADQNALLTQLEEVPETGKWSEVRAFAARSRSSFDASAPCRLFLVCSNQSGSLAKTLSSAKRNLSSHPDRHRWSTPEGAIFGRTGAAGKLGVLFPGQGSQYVGMMRDLACQFPQFQEVFDNANSAFNEDRPESLADRLSDYIYPHPAFDQETLERQGQELKRSQVTQPAIGAACLGGLKVLKSFGLHAEVFGGHSYGELVALHAGGCMDESTFHKLSNFRGRLMADASEAANAGGMLVAKASLGTVEELLSKAGGDLVIANHNAPEQIVLAGKTESIKKISALLTERSIWNRPLPVSAAFHSPLVANARKPFAAVLAKAEIQPASLPVFANTTADLYPDSTEELRTLLAEQLAHPVRFVEQIQAMYQNGVRTFVEVGPGNVLSGLVKAILKDEDATVVSLDATKGQADGMRDLALTLCEIAASGHGINLQLWDEEFSKSPAHDRVESSKLKISICGANQRIEKPTRPPSPPRPRIESGTARPHPAIPASPSAELPPLAQPMMRRTPTPTPAQTTPHELDAALQSSRDGLVALLKLQEQTADLHRKFLEGQDIALQTFLALTEQQKAMPGVQIAAPRPAAVPPHFVTSPAPEIPTSPEARSVPVMVESTPVPAAPEPKDSSPNQSEVARVLLQIVAEKTGYPTEMLNLEMGLDSDLGIDSIKRVEIMSALQGSLPDAPEIKPEQLGSLQTLQEVVDFLSPSSGTESGPQPDAASSLSGDQVAPVLLKIVAEKTGYPTEMLSLEMGLDSDLGIDSIKRVEIMSALQSSLPEAPEIKPEQLGSLQTLQQVVDYLSASPVSAPATPQPTPSPSLSADQVAPVLLEIVAEKTGYPTEMLNLEMGLDSDLGIDSIKRVEIMSALQTAMSELPEIKPENLATFQTLQDVVQFLCVSSSATEEAPPSPAPAPQAAAECANPNQVLDRLVVKSTELHGKQSHETITIEQGAPIWLVDDDTALARQIEAQLKSLDYRVVREPLADLHKRALPDRLGALIILPAAEGSQDDLLPNSFGLIQHAGPALRRTGKTADAVLVTVSRLDGRFGLQGLNGNSNPISGGLAGLTKTVKHEWPEVHCRAIDLDAESDDTTKAARSIVREMFTKGPVEIGLTDQSSCIVELQSIPFKAEATILPLAMGDVVIVSGGGRGVTAETAIALAKASNPTLVILGRSPAPEQEPSWLLSLTETAAIKRAIHAHTGEQPTIREVETHYRRWMGNREITANLQRMEDAGAKVVYRSIDIRDEEAMGSLLAELRNELGPIRGLIHGAGVLADRKIEDKTNEQFKQVYSTKVDGLQALLLGAQDDDLKIIALFSSFTGRYGRTGQVDYAAANEVLNKLAQCESQRRPNCRVVSINWGPWNGGMVNPGLKTLFEQEGVGLIEPQAGADHLVRELSIAANGPVEVVVIAPAAGLGDRTKGASEAIKEDPEPQSLDGEPAFETTVSVKRFPLLRSHVLNGKAVVPVALMVEWMAHGAMHGHPGLVLNGVDNFSVLKGIILKEEEHVCVSVNVLPPSKTETGLLVPVQLVSRHDGKSRIHARAEIQLGNMVLEPATPEITHSFKPDGRTRKEIYAPEFLFHGSKLEGLEQIDESDAKGIAATVSPAPKPSSWINEPLRQTWITEPMMLDCSFQMMILWSLKHQGAHSLPTGITKFRQYVRRFPKDAMTVRIQISSIAQQLVRANMECLDSNGKLLAALEGYECVLDPSLKAAFANNELAQLQQT